MQTIYKLPQMAERTVGEAKDSNSLLDISHLAPFLETLEPQAITVLNTALEIAGDQYHHQFIGTIHVILAFSRDNPTATATLQKMGAGHQEIADGIGTNFGRGKSAKAAFIFALLKSLA